MIHLKKIIAFLLAAVLCIALAACGSSDDGDDERSTTDTTERAPTKRPIPRIPTALRRMSASMSDFGTTSARTFGSESMTTRHGNFSMKTVRCSPTALCGRRRTA